MKTRMEQVAESVALGALRKISMVQQPSLHLDRLERNFRSKWPQKSSRFPINDAMDAAFKAAIAIKGQPGSEWDQEAEGWKTPIADAWGQAVSEAVEEHFDRAQSSFDGDAHLEGAEILTDAVRVALGYIAAVQGWPHGSDDDLYRTAAALATGGGFPKDDENLYNLLEDASEEGMDLCSALGASMGRPDSVRFGLYGDRHDEVKADARLFARMTIDMAKRLAREQAVTP